MNNFGSTECKESYGDKSSIWSNSFPPNGSKLWNLTGGDSQPRRMLSPSGHLPTPRDTFDCPGWWSLPESTGRKLGTLLNNLQSMEHISSLIKQSQCPKHWQCWSWDMGDEASLSQKGKRSKWNHDFCTEIRLTDTNSDLTLYHNTRLRYTKPPLNSLLALPGVTDSSSKF